MTTISHTHPMGVNISDDLHVDRPSSVVEILRMKEDHQTGEEYSLSTINGSLWSLDTNEGNHESSTFRTRVGTAYNKSVTVTC